MTVVFVTDATGSGKGFSAHFKNIKDTVPKRVYEKGYGPDTMYTVTQ